MIDRQHLRIVRAIDAEGTMTEAAKSLFLTQSALSHAMKKLEAHFDVPLWKKDGRRLTLTQAGQSVLGLAHRVLPQFEHTEAQLRRFADGKQGILRIGMECYPCFEWLLKVVAPFLKAFPDVDVDVRRAFSFGGLQALHGYDIDILLTPDPLSLDTITYAPVFEYEQVLVMDKHHPLAKKSFITPQDLSSETLITYPVELSRLDVFTHFLTPANCTVKQHKTIETTEIILQMVAAGRGVTALPKWLIDESKESDLLACRSLGEQGVSKTLYLGHRKAQDVLGFVDDFIALSQRHKP
ncbi:LysR family transcriptional regulator [Alteromonadaceae bacterium A_SAG4]|uniref:LysR family transcriptional regulator n=1 Tax=Alteromonas abrolhosensis TaxID=1892904 RepID=UPI0002DAB6BD|nr:LysR family transcriptional regulator [Alteromonas abrolhosensis]NKW88101.1 LysR family transcriptional regulator [Alteromonadaceae bacterium A_SAG4]NKX03873.1 LysR family transcriptional regulator [Alteromonadaceae bacterium A_SAG6]NKX34516.1 LysR family transcriptional regulator [Alteromonadaceae bacterium A_SAG3]NKX69955.1 LysR family transcriptional regulator [Alteromonadaceae bacterium A_SAG7]|tara:strand:+ start:694 stop:1581 length:888 start_codon:yes stop_codon:yes gene_type:complete